MRCLSVAPEVEVLDQTMPGLDGFRAFKFMRSSPDTAGIKILVLTGFVEPSNVERILRWWADGYMEKPLDPVDLVATVERLLSART
jgi:two-component system cell cycle response regulator DivK